jgi:hypothetical protein
LAPNASDARSRKEDTMARIRVLSPVGVVTTESVTVPPLPHDWTGRTIGFLDNTKSNFDRLTGGIGELLRERHGVKAIVHRRKANAATPASPELIAELGKLCDVVFAGSAD